eukprot:Pgem_evm1s3125
MAMVPASEPVVAPKRVTGIIIYDNEKENILENLIKLINSPIFGHSNHFDFAEQLETSDKEDDAGDSSDGNFYYHTPTLIRSECENDTLVISSKYNSVSNSLNNSDSPSVTSVDDHRREIRKQRKEIEEFTKELLLSHRGGNNSGVDN